MLNDEQENKFLSRIRIGKKNECWPWLMGKSSKKNSQSYGVVWINGKKFRTHRLAFELFHRPLLDRELVCHTCDNPPCCNPHHLFAGNHLDNLYDCISKGRMRKERGTDRYNSKLTNDQIKEIRKRYVPRIVGIDTLAKEFPVCRSMIYAIVTRKRWKHIQ